jgi:hypothetical protein
MNKLVKCFCPFNTNLPVQQVLDFLARQFPGAPFDKTINIEGELVQLEDAALFIKDTISHHSRVPLITNGDQQLMVEFSGFALKKPFGYAGEDVWYLIIEIKNVQPVSSFIDFLEELSTMLHPYWAIINDKNAERFAALQLQPTGYEIALKLGLPRLMPPAGYAGPYVPSGIAWLNYWSKQTVDHMQVSYNTMQEQVYLVKQTSDAGLLFQLTENVLNIQTPQHLQTLVKMYDAYPDVGGRRIQR